MKIHDIINEALPLSTAKEYRKGWDTKTNEELFKRFSKYAIGNGNFRLKFPLKITGNTYDGPELTSMHKVLETLSELTSSTAGSIEHFTGHKPASLLSL